MEISQTAEGDSYSYKAIRAAELIFTVCQQYSRLCIPKVLRRGKEEVCFSEGLPECLDSAEEMER